MERGRSYLILTLTVLAGIALSIFIYLKYRVLFIVFFIPIIGIGGSFLSRMMRRRPMHGHEEKTEIDDYKYRMRSRVEPEGKEESEGKSGNSM
jgi:hypothetical protein